VTVLAKTEYLGYLGTTYPCVSIRLRLRAQQTASRQVKEPPARQKMSAVLGVTARLPLFILGPTVFAGVLFCLQHLAQGRLD